MDKDYLVLVYCSLWIFYFHIRIGNLLSVIKFNSTLLKILFIGLIVIGLFLFKWYMALLYTTIGTISFFLINELVRSYLRKRMDNNQFETGLDSFEYDYYKNKLEIRITFLISLAFIIFATIFYFN